jgi:hypothetical protein
MQGKTCLHFSECHACRLSLTLCLPFPLYKFTMNQHTTVILAASQSSFFTWCVQSVFYSFQQRSWQRPCQTCHLHIITTASSIKGPVCTLFCSFYAFSTDSRSPIFIGRLRAVMLIAYSPILHRGEIHAKIAILDGYTVCDTLWETKPTTEQHCACHTTAAVLQPSGRAMLSRASHGSFLLHSQCSHQGRSV